MIFVKFKPFHGLNHRKTNEHFTAVEMTRNCNVCFSFAEETIEAVKRKKFQQA